MAGARRSSSSRATKTGQELLEEALRVLAPDVIGLELELPRYDLSLEYAPRDGRTRSCTRRPRRSARPGSA